MKRTLYGLGILGLAGFSSAGLTFTGVNDYSTPLSTNPGGKVDAEVSILSSDLYINSASFGSGTLATSGFFLDTLNTRFKKFNSSGTEISDDQYVWGTPLASGFSYKSTGSFDGLFGLFGTATSAGIYTGTVNIFGGSNSAANDLLGTASMTVEVLNNYGISVTYPTSNFTINPGETKYLQHNLTNSGLRNFIVQTRYSSGPVEGGGTNPDGFIADFAFTGYPSALGPNSTTTADHMKFTGVNPTGALWVASGGVIGGYYGDDFNGISGGNFSVQAVPEPATLAVLGLGGALIARRRRKH